MMTMITKTMMNDVDDDYNNGRFQKISIPYHEQLLGFPKGTGGSRLWNSEGMGGYLQL